MDKYVQLAHAIQSAVAYELAHDPSSGTPKHLRVGVNLSRAEHGALVTLLVEKGIITHEEYDESLLDAMEKELDLTTEQARRKSKNYNVTFI